MSMKIPILFVVCIICAIAFGRPDTMLNPIERPDSSLNPTEHAETMAQSILVERRDDTPVLVGGVEAVFVGLVGPIAQDY